MVAVFAGASAVLAGPAFADALNGTYRVSAEELRDGGFNWGFSSCGPDCVTIDQGGSGQLNRQGTVWVGTTNAGCATTIDENSLVGTYQCPMLPPINITLTKT